MNDLHESISSNSFNFQQEYYVMSNKESQDFVEVLEAWARVIGVNLEKYS